MGSSARLERTAKKDKRIVIEVGCENRRLSSSAWLTEAVDRMHLCLSEKVVSSQYRLMEKACIATNQIPLSMVRSEH